MDSYRQWQVSQSDREISSNCGKKATYSVHTKTQSRRFVVSRFLRFVERFWKAPFSWQISVDGRPNRRNKSPFSWRISVDGRTNRRNKAPFSWQISVDGSPNRRDKAPFSWRISVNGRPNRRNKAAFSWQISVDGRPNRRNKAPFSWRISVDGRPNRRNKAPFSWRISADGRPNRRNKAAFLNSYGVVWTRPWSGLIMGMFLRGDGLSLISICEISKVGIFQAAYSSHSRSRKRLRIL